jgi:thymidylate synthase
MIKNIIENGDTKMDRTGTGTKSIFGGMMKYDLN